MDSATDAGRIRGKTFAALKHRDFRLFWYGQAVSLVGTWMQNVGQSWLVLELTHSPVRLGLISTLQFLPMLIFSLFSGVWVDRLPKRKLIIATQTILMLCAFTLFGLTVTGRVHYWHVAFLALVLGCAQSLDLPARQSYFIEMVGKEDLLNAIALNSAVFNGARIIGPAVAGLMVAATGTAWAFFMNGASFIAVITALTMIKAEGLPVPGIRKNIMSEVSEGIRYSISTPMVFTCLVTMSLVSLFSINQQVLVPLLAKGVLKKGAEGLGFIMSAYGSGALLGALAIARAGNSFEGTAGRMRLVFGGAIGLGLSLSLIAVFPQYWTAIILAFAAGASQITFTTSVNTGIQQVVPDSLRGRVMGLYGLVFTGVTPFGSLMMGAAASGLGILATFAIAGLGGVISALVMLAYWARVSKSAGGGKNNG